MSGWNSRVFWAVFGCLACALYVPAYWWVWAPVVYYPLTGDITFTTFFSDLTFNAPRLPKEANAGPAMTWYGWMLSAVIIAAPVSALAALFGNAAVERTVYRYGWWLVVIAIIVTFVIDSKFLVFG